MKHVVTILLAIIIGCLATQRVTAQSIRTEYGKNRIQYHDDFDNWWEYDTENFTVYWYGKGRNIAKTTIQLAEYDFVELQNIVEHKINDKIELVVYTDLSDLLQSNIGVEEIFETRHKETKVIGNRVFLYFNGDHKDLRSQIRQGIITVFLNAMYAPRGVQEIINSEPDLPLPAWYVRGLPPYADKGWNSAAIDELRELWNRDKGRYQDFNCLAKEYPRIAGQSMWHVIEQEFGRNQLTTLLYLMRLRPDLDENLKFLFDVELAYLEKKWTRYYSTYYDRESFEQDFPSDQELPLGFKQYFPKSTMRFSPDGRQLAYVINREGKFTVWVKDLMTAETKRIMQHGYRNAVQQADYQYPVLAWHAIRPELTVAYENRDIITLRQINLRTDEYREQTVPENLQRIFSIDYISDQEYLMSALEDGYSDLFTYHTRYRRVSAITKDMYDDLDAQYVNLGEQAGILFRSNRPSAQIIPNEFIDTILPIRNFDIFFLPLDSDFALQLTHSPDRNELQPRLVEGHYLLFLSQENGIYNRWIKDLNSRRPAYRNSDLPRNIILHDASTRGQYAMETYYNNGYRCYITQPNWNNAFRPTVEDSATDEGATTPIKEPLGSDTSYNLPEELKFVTPFEDPEYIEPLKNNANAKIYNPQWQAWSGGNKNKKPKVEPFIPTRAVTSRRQFKVAEVITKMDNQILFEGLESNIQTDEQDFTNTGFLVKAIAKDIFEDFEVVLGARFPTNFRGSEFFAYVDDKRRRIDKRYAVYRKRSNSLLEGREFNQNMWVGLVRMSYPFDSYRSLRGTASLRVNSGFYPHSDSFAAEVGTRTQKRISLRADYIYDNTIGIDLNLREGTRYKVYAEAFNRFNLGLGATDEFSLSEGVTGILGFDARHYIPFLRNSVLALRAAGATSFGGEPILYYVGGTDGWVSPQFNNNTATAQESYAFQTAVFNLRGFDQNIRNGQSFGVASAELRIPIFKYFSRRELRSKFLRNFQLSAFFDTGSAWQGLLPNKEDQVINQGNIQAPGINVEFELDKSILVYGYGFGARLQLLGHFVRADYAWGVESGFVSDPKLYISLGTEF